MAGLYLADEARDGVKAKKDQNLQNKNPTKGWKMQPCTSPEPN